MTINVIFNCINFMQPYFYFNIEYLMFYLIFMMFCENYFNLENRQTNLSNKHYYFIE